MKGVPPFENTPSAGFALLDWQREFFFGFGKRFPSLSFLTGLGFSLITVYRRLSGWDQRPDHDFAISIS